MDAREQVRDTLARYTAAGDSGPLADLVECFHPDGTLEIKGLPGEPRLASGRAAITTLLSARTEAGRPAHRFVRHHLSSVRIVELSPEAAQATSYFAVFTAHGPDHWGRYRDTLSPVAGRWLIERRRVTVDALAAGSYLA